MSRSFLPMMLTVTAAVGVYYYWSVTLGLNDSAGMALGVGTAVLLSALFARFRPKK
ncbi:MAG: hypothetical protein PWP72_1591 [Thermoanaerobacter sp.]|uniref:hypothetical protein n=1 Tax=Desulfofundulus thermocisternus TaxID=42471 RepID=UPI000AF3F187|nr:hypothetical protein [Desulfofundulus thermocisternus]MDK2888713.1 hypothetical protein [Thermoanaerobacter sp.]